VFAALYAAPVVLFSGVAIKLLDDLLDDEPGYGDLTPAGRAVYALAVLALAMALDARLGFCLFAAAYGLGMLAEPRLHLTTGLPAWLETIIAIGLAALLATPALALQAVLSLGAVQLLDDLIDYNADASLPGRNWARRLGRGEAALAGLIALVLATIPGLAVPLLTVVGYGIISVAACYWRKGEPLWPS
jgi:hypothetical protein